MKETFQEIFENHGANPENRKNLKEEILPLIYGSNFHQSLLTDSATLYVIISE